MSFPDRIMKSSQLANHQKETAEPTQPIDADSHSITCMTQKSNEVPKSSSPSPKMHVDRSTETEKQQKPTNASKRRHLIELGSAKTMIEMSSQQRRRLKVPHPAKLSAQQRRPRRRGLKVNLNGSNNHAHRAGGLVSSTLPASTASMKPEGNLLQHHGEPQQILAQAYICAGCTKPIRDRYLFQACGKFWHNKCLKCDRCQAKLGEVGSSLYAANNMNLCRQDYYELFGQKAICAVCDKLIYASEMVMRARQNVYHLECFACQLCGLRFCIGDRFHLCENKIVCQFDFDEHIYPIQQQQQQRQQQHQLHYARFDFQEATDNQLDLGPFQQTAAPQPAPESTLAGGSIFRPEPNFSDQQDDSDVLVYHTMEASAVSDEPATENRATNQEVSQQAIGSVTPATGSILNESAADLADMSESERFENNSVADTSQETIAETRNG